MKIVPAVPVLAAGLALAGCGSVATGTGSTGQTVAGVGVALHGAPPQPSTPSACVGRWNGAANASGRVAAARRTPKASAALVRTAGPNGYFADAAGRCLVYLIAPPRRAAVFVETARGRFSFTADATGAFAANADVGPRGRLRLR